jgi:hypothetical protein
MERRSQTRMRSSHHPGPAGRNVAADIRGFVAPRAKACRWDRVGPRSGWGRCCYPNVRGSQTSANVRRVVGQADCPCSGASWVCARPPDRVMAGARLPASDPASEAKAGDDMKPNAAADQQITTSLMIRPNLKPPTPRSPKPSALPPLPTNLPGSFLRRRQWPAQHLHRPAHSAT